MTDAEELAEAVLESCAAHRVQEFVVCAGSRNSPLVLEVLRRELPVWSFFEERSAAFFALGRTRARGRPVAVVTTSGTAAAELLPAVIEGHYLGVPILCITADRPENFRRTGAPQAIEQVGLFGGYVQAEWDVSEAEDLKLTEWSQDGPAHLNLCFGEPLLTAPDSEVRSPGFRRNRPSHLKSVEVSETRTIPPEGRTTNPGRIELDREGLLVMLGSLEGRDQEAVLKLLEELDCPILADATGGLRCHPKLANRMLRGGERALQAWKPKSVLRIGGVPSGRFWRDLESSPEVSVWNALNGGFSGLARDSNSLADLESIEATGSPDHSILEADRHHVARLDHALLGHPDSEPGMIRRLSEWIPEGALVFLGNSLPIREWNLAASHEERRHRIFANRGANGIDGNLSTFLGLAHKKEEAWAIVGDLTALYDLAALWILPHLEVKRLRIVIINNGGGRIFSRLPVLGELPEDSRTVTENHHHLRFDHWAAMWGLDYIRVEGDSIPVPGHDRVILEMLPDAEGTAAFHEALNAR